MCIRDRVSLRCELYTVSTTWLFFAISHLAIIMKSDHDQKQPSSTTTPFISTVYYGLQKMLGSKTFLQNENFSWNCTTSWVHTWSVNIFSKIYQDNSSIVPINVAILQCGIVGVNLTLISHFFSSTMI